MSYAERYRSDKRQNVYPVEFVVRAFLGTYPGLDMPKNAYAGRRVLDLGFGDGRNIPFLNDLGMKVHGVETSDDIHRHVASRLQKLGVKAVLKTGSNARIPFKDKFFSFVLSCHSSYYVEKMHTFDTNLAEIARVTQTDGIWVTSLPMADTYILKGAKKLPGGHFEIQKDPYGLRKGVIFRAFDSEEEVKKALKPFFHTIQIGFCDDMYWGIRQKLWIVVCRRNKK